MDTIISFAFVFQIIRISIPYIYPSVGAVFSEKGGVINIALEGILLAGAFATTVGTYYSGNIIVGMLCGVSAGLIIGAIHSVTTITFKANQLVSGLALNLFAVGVTKYFCKIIFNSSSNSARIAGLEQLNINLPMLNNPFILLLIIILPLSAFFLNKTKFGLRLKACGENPEAADTLGINVTKIRYWGVMISSALAAIGGSWLAFDQHSFTDGMSAGRGYIALAAMIIGKWNPLGAAGACLIFGFAETMTLQFQQSFIPNQFVQMLPYVLTIIVLAGFIGKSIPPAADGVPFEKENE